MQQLHTVYMSSNTVGNLITKTITALQHFTTLHPTTLHYTSPNYTSLQLKNASGTVIFFIRLEQVPYILVIHKYTATSDSTFYPP
jgi:hypothetical protein